MNRILSLLLCFTPFFLRAQQEPPTPEQIRQMIAQSVTDLKVAPEAVAEVKNFSVRQDGLEVPVRVYKPTANKPLPVIFMVHGGAWVAGDLDTHDNICRYIANHTEAIVVAVHYRRPPEHKFPAAFNDCSAVLQWIANHHQEIGGNGQLILLGDSAGGQLVASLCLVNAASAKPIPILAQVLVNPGLNLSKNGACYANYAFFVEAYLNPTDDLNDVRLSPGLAKDISKVPNTFIVVGEKDEIREDGESFYRALQTAGRPVTLYVQPGAGHLAALWCAAHTLAVPAMDFVVKSVKDVLSQIK